ncbi:hypothetical protein [uncultured Sphingomonas sp.]|uniref:hypothetical protein n=1 Tax=uncultured Sphingomonas sp. TaxID=158754 RepID=UPI0025E14AF1|nr:hypothetical protein [uncultured Sphingomonas sp.]
MKRIALIPALALSLAACSGASEAPNATDNAAAAAENKAGLDGDVVELPAGEGEGEGAIVNEAVKPGAGEPDAAATARADKWVGRWRGVEGLNLVIAKDSAPGHYTLDMQYSLDEKGKFTGVATAAGIAFTRPDGEKVLRPTDGDATGLKWLAGKKDCLTVASGEGYCRD